MVFSWGSYVSGCRDSTLLEHIQHGVEDGFEIQSLTAFAVKFVPNLPEDFLAKQGSNNRLRAEQLC